MIFIVGKKEDSENIVDIPNNDLTNENIEWHWTHFENPTDEEVALLSTHYGFHHLSIEDCLENIERPKVDYYETYTFLVLHALDPDMLEPVEVDLFIGKNYIVSYCKTKLKEIESARRKLYNSDNRKALSSAYIAYLIMDKIVDLYFPVVYQMEDLINVFNKQVSNNTFHNLIDKIFDFRTDLLKLRHTVNSMKELLYRILNSSHLEDFEDYKRGFNDIYDHLLRLSDMIESSREVTADIRDNYVSVNSHKINKIMTLLTIITSIFIPLTFIVGIYGMNFDYMPELRWRYGYFIVLGLMVVLGVGLLIWFKRKGWFDIKK